MDPTAIFILMTIGLVALFFLGVPIYIAFLICNLLGLVMMIGLDGIGLFTNSIITTATFNSLLTLPFFILMGDILYRSSAVDTLVKASDTLVGRIRGRHYFLSIVVSTILATLAGSAMASAAMLCRTIYPALKSGGYNRSMSLGVIMGGACLAPIIPPSVLAIIIATIAQVSIADMFMAGIIPGLLIGGLFVAYICVRVWINPQLAPANDDYVKPSSGQVLRALFQLLPFSIVILVVTGSIVLGVATPSESAIIATLCALMVAAFYRRLSLSMIIDSLKSTASITGMIMAIIVSSQLFSQLLAFSGTGSAIQQFVTSLDLSYGVMLFLLMAIPFVICMFLDEVAAMLILIPIYMPILAAYEFPSVWFWTLFLINMSLGAIAPPIGYVLFVMKGVLRDVTMMDLFKASIPYVLLFILAMFIMGAFPELVLIAVN